MVAKCLSIGLVMRRAPSYEVTHPPVTLQPTIVSRASLDFVTGLQPHWNAVMDAVARDYDFLAQSLATCASSDTDFTGRLLQMLEDVYRKRPGAPVQSAMLGIFRTDYMREPRSDQEWKNVEINTISCSFAGLAPKVHAFHEFLASARQAERDDDSENSEWTADSLVSSASDARVPAALSAAHECALAAMPTIRGKTPVVVFVVQDNERNTGDQYTLSFNLLQHHSIRSIRRTMSELHAAMQLVAMGDDEYQPPVAVIEGKYVATVFYFRCAYVPGDFKDERCWSARQMIELSSAVKCPSIPYHLAGFKKIQQLLCSDAVLSKYCADPAVRLQLQSTFKGQYSLDADEVGEAHVAERIHDALAHPRKYVLKPQLEGGGNLYAGSKLAEVLRLPPSDAMHRRLRKEFVLMERIEFPKTSGKIFRFGEVLSFQSNLCCELGVFGCILTQGAPDRSSAQTLVSECAGLLVRTKPADVDDGGVMAGVAALDSIAISVERA